MKTGTEFLNHSFQNLLQAKGARHITVNVGDHNRQGLVERFNRTLEGIIALYQENQIETLMFLEILFSTTIIHVSSNQIWRSC